MSGDPAQDYFRSGIAENIVTELTRFRFLFVVSGVDKVPDAREAGLRLGARYAIEGQVHRASDRVRVTAQLIDTPSGSHLWAERFDRAFDDIFVAQDEIARKIVENVVPRIEAAVVDIARRKAPEDMRAHDYHLMASALFQWPRDDADLRQGREYCDRAIALDPSYARGHAQKAFSYVMGFYVMESNDVDEWKRQALICAERAVLLDPMDGFCHWALAEAAFLSKEHDRALDHIARALAINPNNADVLAISGSLRAVTGDPEAGLQQINLALERNPTNPSWYHWLRGCTLNALHRFDEAWRALKLHTPPNPDTLLSRAYALVELDRIEEARAEIQAFLTMRPDATLSKVKRHHDYLPDLDRWVHNLRRAGLPEDDKACR